MAVFLHAAQLQLTDWHVTGHLTQSLALTEMKPAEHFYIVPCIPTVTL